jgi:hypothetical protein
LVSAGTGYDAVPSLLAVVNRTIVLRNPWSQIFFFHYLYDYEIFERPLVYKVSKADIIHSAFRNVTNTSKLE